MLIRSLLTVLAVVCCAGLAFAEQPRAAQPVQGCKVQLADVEGMPFAPRFDFTKEEVAKVASDSRKELDARLEEIVKVPAGKRTFDNTVKAFEAALSDFGDVITLPIFMSYVSKDAAVRDAAAALEEESSKYTVEIMTRRDLYNAVNEFAQTKPQLSDEEQFLLDRIMLGFKRNGLMLSEADLAKYKELKQQLVATELKFEKNIRDWKDQLEVTKEELEGLPEDFIAGLATTTDGKFVVTLNYPDYFPMMDNAKNDDVRRRLEFKFNNRCADTNVQLLEEGLRLRQQLAELLGYKNHAEYQLDDRMAKKPEAVTEFLDRLHGKLLPKAKAEMRDRLDLRAKEAGIRTTEPLMGWQWRYWNNQYSKMVLDIDKEAMKQYFPLETVMNGMLAIYAEVFDVVMEKAALPVWNEEVMSYVMKEKNGEVIGYLFIDLFPRDGKYKHQACFGLVGGRELPGGVYQKPACAIVGNFNRPAAGQPSLLTHDDVETMFHEFGHVTHNLFTKARYGMFSGTAVARDFVEVPSTILENWAWNKDVLERISGHWKNPSEKLPAAMIDRLIKSRTFDSGLVNVRQIFLTEFDMACHTTDLKNTTISYGRLQRRYMLTPKSVGTHPQASFGHLMGGYDAGYYGYLWARAISADIFTEFEKNGVFDGATGKKYRDLILAPGRTADQNVQVQAFLGRSFNEDALLRQFGLETAAK